MKISDSTYKSDGLYPRFYGLPEIHKAGIPLRPIDCLRNQPSPLIRRQKKGS